MHPQHMIKNLVLEGGGVAAIAYVGFLQEAYSRGFFNPEQLTRIAGVSSGAIGAMQIALNYSITEMVDVMRKTDFTKFADSKAGIIADVLRLFTEDGLYKEEYLYCYIRDLIKAKTGDENTTFHDVQLMKNSHGFKDLYVVATKLFILNNQAEAQEFIFSHEHTPHARLVDAIRASASLPLIYPPMRLLEEKDGRYIIHSNGHIFVDGGIINAYPIRIFDYPRYLNGATNHNDNHAQNTILYNNETLGLRLDSRTDIKVLKDGFFSSSEQVIQSNFEYANALLFVLRSGQQNTEFENSRDRQRTVFIDTLGVTSTQFNITAQQQAALIESGRQAVDRIAEIYNIHT